MLSRSQILRVLVIYFCYFIYSESASSAKETGKVIHFKIFTPKYKYSIKEIFPSDNSLTATGNKQKSNFPHSEDQNENMSQEKKNILASSNSYIQSIPSLLINMSYRSQFSPFFKLFDLKANSTEPLKIESDSLHNIQLERELNSTSHNQELSSKKSMISYLGYFKKFLFKQLGLDFSNNSDHSSSMMSLTSETKPFSKNSFLSTKISIQNGSREKMDSSNVSFVQYTIKEEMMSANANRTSESIKNTAPLDSTQNVWNSTKQTSSFSKSLVQTNLTVIQSPQNVSSHNDLDMQSNNYTHTLKYMIKSDIFQDKINSFETNFTNMLTNKSFTIVNRNSTGYSANSNKNTSELFGVKPNRLNLSFKIKNIVELFKDSIKSQIKNSKLKLSRLRSRSNSTSTKKSKVLNNFVLVNNHNSDFNSNYYKQTSKITEIDVMKSNEHENLNSFTEYLKNSFTNKVQNTVENVVNQTLTYQANTTSYIMHSTPAYDSIFHIQTDKNNISNSTLQEGTENEDLLELKANLNNAFETLIDNNWNMFNQAVSNQDSHQGIDRKIPNSYKLFDLVLDLLF
jgi:hypothetical protein